MNGVVSFSLFRSIIDGFGAIQNSGSTGMCGIVVAGFPPSDLTRVAFRRGLGHLAAQLKCL